MGHISSKPTRPTRVPTDTVVPLFSKDDTATNRRIILDFTAGFNDVLDPEKLRGALARLMEIGDWRKLGARLRSNDAGKLEYHIPESFDEKRAAFRYSHVNLETSLSQHPIASKIPTKGTSRPAVLFSNHEFKSLTRTPDHPTKLEDYLYADVGQLFLHIVSFSDATLVTITWPHTLLDAIGLRLLFDAWSAVLSGRESEILPFHGFATNPLENFGTTPQGPFILQDRHLTGISFLVFALRMLWEQVGHPKQDVRTVCLPAAFLSSLKSRTLSSLTRSTTESASSSPQTPKPFLSDNDILTAWITHLALSPTIPHRSTRTICISNIFSLRSTLSSDLLPAHKAYIANAVSGVHALLPASSLFSAPLSATALVVRHSIATQGTRSQQEALASLQRKTGRLPVFGDAGMKLVVFSSWSKARLFEISFEAAVVEKAEEKEEREEIDCETGETRERNGVNEVGRPFWMHGFWYSPGMPTWTLFQIYGRDAEGNYWFNGRLGRETWEAIEEGFRREFGEVR